MRITNGILRADGLAGMQRGMRGLHESQTELTTGRRFEAASGDPAAAAVVTATDSQLRSLVQYGRNIGAARTRLLAEETVLDQLGGILERARELAVAQGGDTATAETRRITRAEVDELLHAAVQLGNTRSGDAFLFGGDYRDAAPFRPDGSHDEVRAPRGEQAYTIASGQTGLGAHDGGAVFVDSGVIDALRALAAALDANDAEGIRAAGTLAATAHGKVQVLVGEVGARSIRLEVAETNIQALELNLRTLRSDLSEVDFEAAVSRLVSRQSAFEAALLATSRVLSTSLTDYLR